MSLDYNGVSFYPYLLIRYNADKFSESFVIPKGYKKYYPKPLPKTAVLWMQEGRFWNVKWKKSEQDSTISFHDGWNKFVKDNNLQDNDLIHISYDGIRSFWIQIYQNGVVKKTKNSVAIQEISSSDDNDDDDDKDGDDDNITISLSYDSNQHDDDDDDIESCEKSEIGRTPRIVKRGGDINNPEKYLDDPNNLFFIATSSSKRHLLVVPKRIRLENELKFGPTIHLIDEFGEIISKVRERKDRVVIWRWDEIYERNNAKPGDLIICEILRNQPFLKSIKVHFVEE